MSDPIIVEIPHGLGAAEAKRRIDQGFARLAEQIGGQRIAQVKRKWAGDRLAFSVGVLGQAISGEVLVMTELVRIEVQLPPLLSALAGGIKPRLQKQAQVLLEKK
jgi:putative polyhydroxyalkanoate system protein